MKHRRSDEHGDVAHDADVDDADVGDIDVDFDVDDIDVVLLDHDVVVVQEHHRGVDPSRCVVDDAELASMTTTVLKVGSTWAYNGGGHVLGGKIENVNGEVVPLFYKKHVLDPLGCTGTEVSGTHADAFSIPLDIAKLGQMLLNRGAYGKYRFFSKGNLRADAAPEADDRTRPRRDQAIRLRARWATEEVRPRGSKRRDVLGRCRAEVRGRDDTQQDGKELRQALGGDHGRAGAAEGFAAGLDFGFEARVAFGRTARAGVARRETVGVPSEVLRVVARERVLILVAFVDIKEKSAVFASLMLTAFLHFLPTRNTVAYILATTEMIFAKRSSMKLIRPVISARRDRLRP